MLDDTRNPPDPEQFSLSTSPPGWRQVRLAALVVLGLLAALLATTPFARVPLSGTEPLLPAYAAALLVNELITAALLLSLFSIERSVALLVLACGYLFSALLVVPWTITFPGVFSPGLLDDSLQSTAAFAGLRRIGFPLFVFAYVVLRAASPVLPALPGRAPVLILASVATVAAVAGLLTWFILFGDAPLPRLMVDHQRTADAWQYVPATAAILCVTALTLLWLRQRSLLDLWLMVVLSAFLIEILLLAYLSSGRFSVGWWAGRAYGLASASVVLLVLLSETNTLHARLIRSLSAERRARDARLTAMEALSASIAHEINQPLASMVTNADAALRWLDHARPDIDEARAALRRIATGGHRAGQVIESVRAMFGRGVLERGPLDVNALILEVLRDCQRETRFSSVTVRTMLDSRLPRVIGHPIQLQQVISNLVSNAIDAMCLVVDRPRELRIRTERSEAENIGVSVEDSGPGIAPGHRDRIFEPFFTTKPHGMGMGLMFCRSVVESHGGRLEITDNRPHGVAVRFTLPVDETAVRPAGEPTS